MIDWLVPLLSVLLPVLLTGLFNIWLYRKQMQKEAAREEATTQKIMGEAWQMVNDELKKELTRLKDDRDEFRAELEQAENRIAKLEEENMTLAKTLIKERELRRKLEGTIVHLRDDLRRLGKTTDELKSETGQVKTQKRGKDASA